MLQQLIVVLIFVAAMSYLGRLVYKAFVARSACSAGCGKCSAIDLDKIEKQLKQKKI